MAETLAMFCGTLEKHSPKQTPGFPILFSRSSTQNRLRAVAISHNSWLHSRPKRPDGVWGPSSFLFSGRRGALHPVVEQPGRETDHSPPSSSEIKSNRSCIYHSVRRHNCTFLNTPDTLTNSISCLKTFLHIQGVLKDKPIPLFWC